MKNRIKFTQHSTRDTSPRTEAYAIKSKEDAEFYTNTANAHKMNHRQTFRRNICYLDISKYNYKNLIFIYSKQTTQKAMNCQQINYTTRITFNQNRIISKPKELRVS